MGMLEHIAVTFFLAASSFVNAMLGGFHPSDMNNRTMAVQNIPVQIVSSTLGVTSTTVPGRSQHKQESAATAIPIKDVEAYRGDGYSISIPNDFIYGVATGSLYALLGSPSRDTWHSADETQAIGVDWEVDSASAKIRRLEETQLIYAERAKTRPQMSPVTVSHPAIGGAASSALLEKPLYPEGTYGVYLFVEGTNGNIYSIFGLSSTAAARSSVTQIVKSFSLEARSR